MSKLLLLCMSLLVTSCATNPPPEPPIAREVHTITTVKCIPPEKIPVAPRIAFPADADVGQEAEAVSAYARSAQRYIARADDLMKLCAQ